MILSGKLAKVLVQGLTADTELLGKRGLLRTRCGLSLKISDLFIVQCWFATASRNRITVCREVLYVLAICATGTPAWSARLASSC